MRRERLLKRGRALGDDRARKRQESSADLSLINNACRRAASSVAGSGGGGETISRREVVARRGTGGAARWDESEEWRSHLRLSPPRSSLSDSPSGLALELVSERWCVRMCTVTLVISSSFYFFLDSPHTVCSAVTGVLADLRRQIFHVWPFWSS